MAEWWSDATIARLRTLWDEGLSTAEIGRRLGVSKNAVVGKSHRLELPARPSPIVVRTVEKRREEAPKLRRAKGPTFPPLPEVCAARPSAAPADPRPAPAIVTVLRPFGAVSRCCWLDGARPNWRRCDAPTLPGSDWCRFHRAKVYVRRRSAAA